MPKQTLRSVKLRLLLPCSDHLGNASWANQQMNFACNYLTGDVTTVPNPRNGLGKARQWEWYQHLAQHPLVAPVHRANVSELSDTLLVNQQLFAPSFR